MKNIENMKEIHLQAEKKEQNYGWQTERMTDCMTETTSAF